MNYRNDGIMPFEVEVLFRQILNMDQIKYITSLLIALGKYMVLDREMLDKRAGKIGLSYIRRATETKLITEYRHRDDQQIHDYYFYSLAPGGIYFLESEGFPFHKLPKYTNQQHRERILTFNKWALEQNYTMNANIPQSRKFDYFITNEKNGPNTIVGFYENMISEQQAIDQIQIEIDEAKKKGVMILDENYDFEKIKMPMIEIGNKSSSF